MRQNHPRALRALPVLVAMLAIAPVAAFAEDFLFANDLEAAKLVEATKYDNFTIYARSDKGVTIETIDQARSAEDGEVFNARIKLNGGGALDYRSVRFTTAGKAEVSIYLNSSSKTDSRVLKVVDASGETIAELAAPPDTGTSAGLVSVSLPKAGEYAIFSASGGINLYGIIVE